ncbi:MAG: perosamine synthetase, partial [Actinomycetota bacterium]|nr:perosamine synthetase [Actinomycetota bacterium]
LPNVCTGMIARTFRNPGQQFIDGSVEFVMAGDNLRLTDVQGAIGVAQMARLPGLVEARSHFASRYDEMLAPLRFMPQHRGSGAAVQSYVVLAPAEMRASEVISELRTRGIEATVGTNAIPFTRYYSSHYGIAEVDLPHTVAVSQRAVTLPLFPQMTEAVQDTVVQALAEIVQVVVR